MGARCELVTLYWSLARLFRFFLPSVLLDNGRASGSLNQTLCWFSRSSHPLSALLLTSLPFFLRLDLRGYTPASREREIAASKIWRVCPLRVRFRGRRARQPQRSTLQRDARTIEYRRKRLGYSQDCLPIMCSQKGES